MRMIVLTAALAAGVWLVLPHVAGKAADADQPAKASQPPYVHSVIFYLKKDTPPAKVEACIADCHKVLAKISTVRSLWVGRPAEKATDVAVKDFQIGLTVVFDNYEGLKMYLDNPTHLKFVDTYLPLVDKVLVYDVLDQAK